MYAPPNYNPFGRQPAQETVEIPQYVRGKGIRVGGVKIKAEGSKITVYRMRYGKLNYAEWDGLDFGSWWEVNQQFYPEGCLDL